jgi:outer membrane phospholipase A
MDKKLLSLIIFIAGLIVAVPAFASSAGCEAGIKLQDYEPNTVAIRKDDNDEANIDFTLSQMVPLFHDGCARSLSFKDGYVRPYFAFTGQFGFYALGNRSSKPVIGKRFNPKLFLRHWIGKDGQGGYIDIGYAHESNGQSINTEQAYLQKRAEIVAQGERIEFANDYLSRGWDYLDFILKLEKKDDPKEEKKKPNFYTSAAYLKLKYFFEYGLFQGEPEEAYVWETNDPKSRSEFDGISIMLKSSTFTPFRDYGLKIALIYITGYKHIFQNSTVRFETTAKIDEWLPIQFWFSRGFNSDLTDYYKQVTSVGLGFELRNFISDL